MLPIAVFKRFFLIFIISLTSLSPLFTQVRKEELKIVFLEAVSEIVQDSIPIFFIVTDTAKISQYQGWLNNGCADLAFKLYSKTFGIVEMGRTNMVPTYYIALTKGGNNAALGFKLKEKDKIRFFLRTPYIKLDPSEWLFTTTLLHETGHMILAMLNHYNEIPKRQIACIPHSTAALTDRGTAFDEGFAIHLEALEAEFINDPVVRSRYHHDQYLFGVPYAQGSFYWHTGDILNYSQTRTRYYDVRENNFAFSSFCKEPDYLRIQLDKSRDFSLLRTANQLLQSEGFYASFFFSYIMEGKRIPTLEQAIQKEISLLNLLYSSLKASKDNSESPFLLNLIVTSLNDKPTYDLADIFLDLTHGVFMDNEAIDIWRNHYLNAIKLDLKERSNLVIENKRKQWKQKIQKNPQTIYSLIGPQLKITVPGVLVQLVAFEEKTPLSFDINTAEQGVIKLIPEISETEVKVWIIERQKQPFSNFEDFKERVMLTNSTLEKIKIG